MSRGSEWDLGIPSRCCSCIGDIIPQSLTGLSRIWERECLRSVCRSNDRFSHLLSPLCLLCFACVLLLSPHLDAATRRDDVMWWWWGDIAAARRRRHNNRKIPLTFLDIIIYLTARVSHLLSMTKNNVNRIETSYHTVSEVANYIPYCFWEVLNMSHYLFIVITSWNFAVISHVMVEFVLRKILVFHSWLS